LIRKLLYRNFRLLFKISRRLERRLTTAGAMIAGGMISAGVFGIDTRQTLAFQIFALCVSLLFVAALASYPRRPRLEIRRKLPRYTTAGVSLSYSLYVRNRGTRPERDLHIADELDKTLPSFEEFSESSERHVGRNWFDRAVGYPRWVAAVRHKWGARITRAPLPVIPAGEEIEIRIPLRPERRGYLHFTETIIVRPDPLGLVFKIISQKLPETLLVLPKRYPSPELKFGRKRKYQPGGEGMATSVGDSQEFSSLRDYRPGDPLRHIHWRSWAKLGKPVVKEYQDEFFDRQALILDTYCDSKSAGLFEEAVSVAASFACADWGPDTLLDLLFVGHGAERFTAGRGLADTANMLEVLACVERVSEGAFADLGEIVLGHAGQIGSAVCVFLDWDESRQQLVKRLRTEQLNVLALVMREPGAPPLEYGVLAEDPTGIYALPSGDIAQALANFTETGSSVPVELGTGTDG